jgi:hypothetical protein
LGNIEKSLASHISATMKEINGIDKKVIGLQSDVNWLKVLGLLVLAGIIGLFFK